MIRVTSDPAAPFVVGDRVRIGGTGDSGINGRIGDVGRVYRNRDRPGHWLIIVRWDEGRSWAEIPSHCAYRV